MIAPGTTPKDDDTSFPADTATEAALLGGVLLDESIYPTLHRQYGLGQADFVDPEHRKIVSAMQDLYHAERAIDTVSIIARLKERGELGDEPGQVGIGLIGKLVNDCPHAANVPTYAEQLIETSKHRSIFLQALTVAEDARMRRKPSGELLDSLRWSVEVIGRRGRTNDGIVSLDTIEERAVEWLWQERFIVGKMNLVSGEPGGGKTFFTMDLAAKVSTGAPFPDLAGVWRDPGGVLVINAEDDPADTLVPRLKAAEADLARIHILENSSAIQIPRDLDRIRAAIERVPDCKLLILDPIGSFLGKSDSHNDAEVRSSLGGLIGLAAEFNIALVVVAHLRKSGGRAIDRTMGSVAFVGMARAAWMVVEDAEQPGRKLLLRQKCNLSRVTSGLAYRLEGRNGFTAPYVAWEADTVEMTADEAFEKQDAKKKPRGRIDMVKDWLAAELAGGEKPQVDVLNAGVGRMFSPATIRRAFKDLGGMSRRTGFRGPWHWSLPQDTQSPPDNEF